MINAVHNSYAGAIQSYTKFTVSNNLSDGTCLQTAQSTQAQEQTPKYDNLELSQEQSQVTLNAPDEISIDIPRRWIITGETAKSYINHLQWSLDEADRQNLSFGERLTFLKEQSQNWVEDKRQNDPEMFAAWLQINKHHIQSGEADLVGLPSNFTMENYYSYVKEPFSAFA